MGSTRWRSRTWPVSPAMLLAVLVGSVLLAVTATTAWTAFGDEHAYWLAAQRLIAGRPLYDPTAPIWTPYAYWYPPPLAQVLAPLTLVLPDWAFSVLWLGLLLASLWYLSGRRPFVAIAMVAFVPVALELAVRNVHLLIAGLVVLALRRSWVFWVPATALKLAPGLGVVYLLAAGRRREAVLVALFGAAVAGVSFLLAPDVWIAFLQTLGSRAGESSGLLPVPNLLRVLLAVVLAIAAGRRGGRVGEICLVIAVTFANPTLWANALSVLVAIVPLWQAERPPDEPMTSSSGGVAVSGG